MPSLCSSWLFFLNRPTAHISSGPIVFFHNPRLIGIVFGYYFLRFSKIANPTKFHKGL